MRKLRHMLLLMAFLVRAEEPEAPRKITDRGMLNLVAFARLFGYVRYFHPSDESTGADWEQIAIAGARTIEGARDTADLVSRLRQVFSPLAPAVSVSSSITSSVPIKQPPGTKTVYGEHRAEASRLLSTRLYSDVLPRSVPPPDSPFEADLGDGIRCQVPVSLFAVPQPPRSAEAVRAANAYSAKDRAVRLGDVIILWNLFQHFYVYSDVVRLDWPALLQRSLRAAATDPDELHFLYTLQWLVAALQDGHAGVSRGGRFPNVPPITLAYVDGQLVVTYVAAAQGQPISPGDAVVEIDGKPSLHVLTEREALTSGGTSQNRRQKALASLLEGPLDKPVTLLLEPFGQPRVRKKVIARRREASSPFGFEPRPDKIAELKPGVFYVNMNRATRADFDAALARLLTARGIIFDIRLARSDLAGYLLPHLLRAPFRMPQWFSPVTRMPDRLATTFEPYWTLMPAFREAPQEPYFPARKVFVTNARAISNPEKFLAVVEDYKLGPIVGEASGGTNGTIRREKLPGDYVVSFTWTRVLKPDGSQHHGIGILPTIPVSRTRAGIAAGRDELFDKALHAVMD